MDNAISLQLAREIVTHLPGIAYLKDKNGVVLWCSNAQPKALGLENPAQVIGKTAFDFMDKKTALRVHQNDLEIMNSGKSALIEEEFRVNGHKTVMLSHKTPYKDDHGNVIGIIGCSVNITGQKVIQDQLAEENYQNKLALENIVSNLPGHIYWKDKSGVVLGCNDKQAEFIGFPVKQILGKRLSDLIDKRIAEKIHENDLQIMRSGKTEIIEEPIMLKGKQYVFVSHKAPLKDPATGKIIGVLRVSIDVTKQKELEQACAKQAQELTQALEVKEDFLNNMSHEVRTPLQGIVGMADALEGSWDETPDDIKKNCIKGLLEARDRLMNLMSNLLDLSNFAKGRVSFDFKYHDIKLLIIEVITEFQYITEPIDFSIAGDVDVHVCCDDWRLKQVIRNVIANSVKHGGKDKLITISLTTYQDEDTKYLKIAIQDEGVGVPEDELEAIFDPFHESKRTKRKSGGTGMGLTLCKDIIIAHKGTMWVENNEKVGSTFYIAIPYEKQSQQVYTFRMTRRS